MGASYLDERFNAIERRLARVEQLLGVVTDGSPPVRVVPQAVARLPDAFDPDNAVDALLAPEPYDESPGRQAPVEAAVATHNELDVPAVGTIEYEPAAAPATAPVLHYRAAPKRSPIKQGALEQTIGLKWAGWIGAVVLVIGAGFGIKYAYDQHLFPVLSYTTRLILMALGGFGLIGAGEWVFRKVNKLSATGLFGAGVAVLFLVSYAGHAYYGLYERNTAFTFIAIATLVGSAVAMRGNLVSIAVLSLVGGTLAPALLHGDQPNVFGFLTYLLTLQLVALVLAYWGASRKWWTLRGVSFAGSAMWVTLVIGRDPFAGSMLTLVFALAYAGLFQAELILSGLRKRKWVDTARYTDDAGTGLNFSILVTAAVTVATLYLLRESSDIVRTINVLAFAAVTGALAALLSRDRREPPTLKLLATGYTMQAAALLALAVPVALSGLWIAAGWGILAIAFAIVGVVADQPVARYSALATWVLGVIDLFLWTQGVHDHSRGHADQIWLTVFGHGIAAYAVMGWLLAVAGHIVALLTRRGATTDRQDPRRVLGGLLDSAAGVVWVFVTIAALPPLGATAWLLGYAWLLTIADAFAPQATLLALAIVMLALAAAKWVVIDTLAPRLAPGWTPGNQWPLFNPTMMTGGFVAASIVGICRVRRTALQQLMRRTDDAAALRLPVIALLAVLIAFGLSAEIERVVERAMRAGDVLTWPGWQLKQMAWTMLWSMIVSAFATITSRIETNAARRREWLRSAQSLLAALAVKFFVLDTLLYSFHAGPAVGAFAVFNLQSLEAVAVAASLLFVRHLVRRDVSTAAEAEASTWSPSFIAVLILLWAGTMEIDRLVERFIVPGAMGMPLAQWKHLLWTTWWMLGASGYLLGATRFIARDAASRTIILKNYWKLPVALAVKFVIIDTGFWRLARGAALGPVLANPQALAAAVVLAGLVLVLYLVASIEAKDVALARICKIAAALAVIVLLWSGTLEIDRLFHGMVVTSTGPFANPELAEQVALSVFWSVFAIAAVAAGFGMRVAGLRYFGLGLFAVTLLKVVTIDMSEVSTGYRILSFVGLGGLLLVTSVLYGKLSPVLLKELAPE